MKHSLQCLMYCIKIEKINEISFLYILVKRYQQLFHDFYLPALGPVSRKSRKLFGPGKPFVELRPAYSIKLVFSYVVKGIEIKVTAKFRASRRLRFEDTKRIMSPEMCPKRFGTFEKRATGLYTNARKYKVNLIRTHTYGMYYFLQQPWSEIKSGGRGAETKIRHSILIRPPTLPTCWTFFQCISGLNIMRHLRGLKLRPSR